MTEVKIVEIDGQTAILLPPETAAHLNAKPGGVLSIVHSSKGAAWLFADDRAARQIGYAQDLMREFPQAFKTLAT
jgi:hypothetical protein